MWWSQLNSRFKNVCERIVEGKKINENARASWRVKWRGEVVFKFLSRRHSAAAATNSLKSHTCIQTSDLLHREVKIIFLVFFSRLNLKLLKIYSKICWVSILGKFNCNNSLSLFYLVTENCCRHAFGSYWVCFYDLIHSSDDIEDCVCMCKAFLPS